MKRVIHSIIFVLTAVVCSADVINLYFAGGQSNAKAEWAAAIEAELSQYVGNVEVVHVSHDGNAMDQWYTTSPQANYEADFFNGGGSGVLETRIAEIESTGDTVDFKGLFWFQGESDTVSTNTMDQYAGRFNGMLTQLKSDLGMTNDVDFTMALIDLNSDPYYDDPVNAGGRSRGDIEYMRTVQSNICNSAHGVCEDTRSYARADAWYLVVDPDLIDFGTAMAHTHLGKFGLVPVANTVELGSHSADGSLINTGTDANQNIIAARTSNNQCNGILFFEIPEDKVLNAQLTLRVHQDKGNLPAGTHIDMWALGYQSVPQMIGSWNSTSNTDTRLLLNGSAPVKIADNFVDAEEPTPVGSYWSTTQSEGATLAEFINNVKANGAVAGDYIVLRLNHDVFLDADAGTRWGSSSHTGYEPVLTLQVEQLGFPPARTAENGYWIVGSHSADGAISESGVSFTSQSLISSTGGTGPEPWNGICFFELPPQPLTDADMELTVYDQLSGTVLTNNVDLWGLGYQSSPGMNTSWYISADSDDRTLLNGAKPVKIADNIAEIGNLYSAGHIWSPDAPQKMNLKNYINHLFDLGAKPGRGTTPGDYAVFRVNMDSRVYGQYYGVRWGSSGEAGFEPVFTGLFNPGENRLLNGDMESGTPTSLESWGVSLNHFQFGQTNLLPRSGDYCMRMGAGPEQTSNTVNNVNSSQEVSRDDWAGKHITFSCYARQDPNDPLQGSVQKLEIRIYYLTDSGSPFTTSSVSLRATDPVDEYKFISVTGVAPEGTTKIRAQFIFRTGTPSLPPDDPITGGAVLVDDARLEIFEPLPDPVIPGTLILLR